MLFIQKIINKFKKTTPENKARITVIGDSHCSFFSGNERVLFTPIKGLTGINSCNDKIPFFKTFHLGSALAYNLNKYNTTTKGREKIECLINKGLIPENSKIICCFGEIDIRVHVLYQAEKQNKTYEEIIDEIIDNYSDLLLYLKKTNKVYVWGPICTQKDGSIQNKGYPYYGTETERNITTEYFNKKLEEKCNEIGVGFLSIFKDLTDENYKSKKEYIPDGYHLSRIAWEFALKELAAKGVFDGIFKE